MVASKITGVINADFADNSLSPALGCSSLVPCSICFDLVIDDGERSIAKLHCGHKFHLDCIGSAFNAKGTMQCPNCRTVESGRWLFADGSAHAISATGQPNWMPNEGPHDLSYSRRPSGFRWCPFSGFTVHSSVEEADSSLNTFANFHGNHAMITEHTPGLPSARSYISHFRPSERIVNTSFHHPLNSHSAPRNNIHSRNIRHPNWGWNCHFVPYNADRDYIDHGNLTPVNPATLRSTHSRPQADVARSASFLHPWHYTQQPFSRPGESSAPNSQSRERTPILHTSYPQGQPSEITNMPPPTNGFRRFNSSRGLPMILPAVPGRHHHHGFHIRETERDETPSYVPIMRESFNYRFSRSSDSGNWS